jgi:acetyltransferase-like isoleucine patch superfamily enzyme
MLSGNVHVGPRSHVGVGATVIQGVHIGSDAIVGAGAVVLSDVPESCTVVGIPARPIQVKV